MAIPKSSSEIISSHPETRNLVLPSENPGLQRLLSSDCLAVQRELEFANILIGYEQVEIEFAFSHPESKSNFVSHFHFLSSIFSNADQQANKYSIRDRNGEVNSFDLNFSFEISRLCMSLSGFGVFCGRSLDSFASKGADLERHLLETFSLPADNSKLMFLTHKASCFFE